MDCLSSRRKWDYNEAKIFIALESREISIAFRSPGLIDSVQNSVMVNVLKFCTTRFETRWNMKTVQTQI